jgi:hypothetical protein
VYQRALIGYDRWRKLPGEQFQESVMDRSDPMRKKGAFGGGGVHRPVRT